jgi:hypothetical protein
MYINQRQYVHTLRSMYMKFNNVAEFRKRLKEALDWATDHYEDDDDFVEIKRGNRVYHLFDSSPEGAPPPAVDAPPASSPEPLNTIEAVNQKLASDAFAGKPIAYCKHDYPKGLCKFGCK